MQWVNKTFCRTNQPTTFNLPIILRYLVLSHPLQSDFVSIWKVCGLHHHLSIIIRRVLSHGFQKRISKIWILWQECSLCTIQNLQLWNFTLVQQDLEICGLGICSLEMCGLCSYVALYWIQTFPRYTDHHQESAQSRFSKTHQQDLDLMPRMHLVRNTKFTIIEFHTCTASPWDVRPRNTWLWCWKLHYFIIFIKVGSSYRYDMKNQRAYSLPPLIPQSAHCGVLSESVCSASFAILEFSCFRGTQHMNFVCNNREDFFRLFLAMFYELHLTRRLYTNRYKSVEISV